jgi:hypothetical protein
MLNLFAANGSKLFICGIAELQLHFSGLGIPQTVAIVENLNHNFILGVDFMQRNHVLLDFNLGTISICDDLVRLHLHKEDKKECFAKVHHAVCLQPNTENLVQIKCTKRFLNQDMLIEPIP